MSKGKNAFDDLLASITDDSDRQVITGLAEKYPDFRPGYMRQSDYSRKMDELRADKDYADAMKQWREQNWVENAYGDGRGALKRELDKDAQIQELSGKVTELEQQIQIGGEVNFDDLGKYLTDKGYVSQDSVGKLIDSRLSGEKQTVEQMFAGFGKLVTQAPRLAIRHYKTFGEELDTEALIEHANKSGIGDLQQAYDSFTAEQRQALEAKRREEELETIKRQTREEVEKELAAKHPAAMPVDDSGPEMGHFQKRILGIADDGSVADDKLELGRGSIAYKAAREFNSAKSE